MRMLQMRTLEKLGITSVTEAGDGAVALNAFKTAAVDLVMTDWNMPNMDGLTLVREIRKLNQTVPILMITTEAERSRVVTAIQAGVNDYLVKPFTADLLKAKLEKLLASVA
jgi:two-component system chemotaxis response regulator CheY